MYRDFGVNPVNLTKPSQSPAEIGVCNGQRLRQRLPDRPKPGKLGLECLPDRAKLGRLNRQRRFPGLQLPHGPAQTGVLLAQHVHRRLLAPRPPQGRTQLSSLVGRQLRQHRPGRPKLGEPGLQLLLTGFGHLQGMAQPENWTLLTKVETSCDRILIAGGANVEAEWEQGPAV